MDDLAHQPELRLYLVCQTAQPAHEVEIQHIGCVQTDAVDVELFHPEADGIIMVLLHLRVALVQLDQQVVAAPVAVGKAVVILVVAPEVHIAEPVLIAGVLAVRLQVPEREEIAAHMVEHAVHDDPLPAGVAGRHKSLELLVGAKAAVHKAVVDGIVAVGAALEQRADINGRAAEVFISVFGPCVQLFKGTGRGLAVVLVRTAAQSQRINVIKYSVVIPSHRFCLSHSSKRSRPRPMRGQG